MAKFDTDEYDWLDATAKAKKSEVEELLDQRKEDARKARSLLDFDNPNLIQRIEDTLELLNSSDD